MFHRLIFAAVAIALSLTAIARAERPNVILVMTDDQGYGEIAAHGNDIIKTPNLDALHSQSVRLTNFHVDPTCSPTRSALMTGKYSTKTGVWHTIMGRSLMRGSEVTIAEVLRDAGYKTAMIGKWHLGDNYPTRPQDQGFDHAFYHGGGGVGQGPDYFGNDYFDDTYFRWDATTKTLRTEKQTGYCTDIWFDDAINFIQKNKGNPFFVYLATNSPHGPYLVPEKYSQPYEGKQFDGRNINANFYGMITNIDENMGKLMGKLDEWKLADNTILIFMTDNGSSSPGFNAGMRGRKGSEYDGGHRVPFFIRWPAGGIGGAAGKGRDEHLLSAHIDVLPTIAELCGAPAGKNMPRIDGMSVMPALKQIPTFKSLDDRTLFVHSQRIEYPEKWRKSAVMTRRWRLVNGKELFDMQKDASQKNDVAEAHPQIVKELTAAYDKWWADLETTFDKDVRIVVGSEHENPVRLMSHDWHGKSVPWNQSHVKRGTIANGYWLIDVAQAGEYEIELRRWPTEKPGPIEATEAKLQINDAAQTQKIDANANAAAFKMKLDKGPARLQTWLSKEGAQARGAYYVYIKRLQ